MEGDGAAVEDGGWVGDGDDPNCDRNLAASGVRTWYLEPGGFCDEPGFVGMRAGSFPWCRVLGFMGSWTAQ